MDSAQVPRLLTVKQAAVRLAMTPQGVRKAVREHRLEGTTRLLPSGKREYALSERAIEAFSASRASPLDDRVEILSMRLELAERALHEKDVEIVVLKGELATAQRDLGSRTRALHLQIKAFEAFVGGDDTHSKAIGGME